MSESHFKIAGAGPAGLTAAIVLANAGARVTVYERRKGPGRRFHGDLQGLENWTTESDVVNEISALGIDAQLFDCHPIHSLLLSDGQKLNTNFDFPAKPLTYLVKRGDVEGSLDRGLVQQAKGLGVNILWGTPAPDTDTECTTKIDLWATGPSTSAKQPPAAIDKGIVFKTNAPDMAIGFLSDKAAYQGYAYLLVTQGYGCLATVLFHKFDRMEACWAETQRLAEQHLEGYQINDIKKVGGLGAFWVPPMFGGVTEGLRAGEAAGLQDLLWGFGIRKAIESGAMAAKALLGDPVTYPSLATDQFLPQLKSTVVLRWLYERLSRNSYAGLVQRTSNQPHVLTFLGKAHKFGRKHRWLYPLAHSMLRRRYDLK